MTLKDKTWQELLRAAMNYRLLAAMWMERAELLQQELARLDPDNVLLDLERPPSEPPLSIDHSEQGALPVPVDHAVSVQV